MPLAAFTISVNIHARPEEAFAYVADLTRHASWSANPLKIEALSAGPVAVGSRYRSTAHVRGAHFNAELQVTEYQPPSHFAFGGEDATGKFEHQFIFQPQAGGVRVERRVRFRLTLWQWLMFQLLLYPVRLPAGKRALALLKSRLERQAGADRD